MNATHVFGNYIDEPIQMRRDLHGPSGGQPPQDFYYHPDELFSVVAITNAGGAVVERVRYGDYGNATVTDASGNTLGDTSTIANRFAFTGREYDEETDLSYYRTRYLEHAWGRFTTRDTIGIWGERENAGSACAYGASAPLSFVDPDGRRVQVCQRATNSSAPADAIGRACGVRHHWIKTDSNERGLGPAGGGVPGQGVCAGGYTNNLPFVGDTEWTDHKGQHAEPGAECFDLEGCDEACVDREITRTGSQGACGITSNCQTKAADALRKCGCKPVCMRYGYSQAPNTWNPMGEWSYEYGCVKWSH